MECNISFDGYRNVTGGEHPKARLHLMRVSLVVKIVAAVATVLVCYATIQAFLAGSLLSIPLAFLTIQAVDIVIVTGNIFDIVKGTTFYQIFFRKPLAERLLEHTFISKYLYKEYFTYLECQANACR
mgnify:CR=1 FL=1